MVRLHHVSELRCHDALLVGLYYIFKLLCHDLHLVGFNVSSNQTPIFSSSNPERNKKSSLDYKLAELLLYLKPAAYIYNSCKIYWADIYISSSIDL